MTGRPARADAERETFTGLVAPHLDGLYGYCLRLSGQPPDAEEGLEKREVDELETHLGVCERCCGELEFSRQLRQRVADAEVADLPAPVRERITQLLDRDAASGE